MKIGDGLFEYQCIQASDCEFLSHVVIHDPVVEVLLLEKLMFCHSAHFWIIDSSFLTVIHPLTLKTHSSIMSVLGIEEKAKHQVVVGLLNSMM